MDKDEELIWDDVMKHIRDNNRVMLQFDIKPHLEKILNDALKVVTNDEGDWEITDSSISMAIDDILTYYDLTERADGE